MVVAWHVGPRRPNVALDVALGHSSVSCRAPPPLQVETQLYSVRPYGAKEGEAPLQVARSLLRHRKVHTKAIFGITDDKKHDSFAAQWFMKATLNILQTKYVDTGLSHLVSKPGCCVAQLRCSGAPAKL